MKNSSQKIQEDKVTIIVPVYNVEAYLKDCLESITAQTYSNLEIILVNDGSTDGSVQIAEEFAKKDLRIKLISQENGGLSKARNTGLNHATGDWILMIDSDDYIDSCMTETMLSKAQAGNADIVVCGVQLVDEKGSNLEQWIPEPASASGKEALPAKTFNMPVIDVIACNKLYRRKIFDRIRYPEGRLHEDEAIIHLLYYEADKIEWIEDPLYFYRQRKGSIMQTKTARKDLDKLLGLGERILFLQRKGSDRRKTDLPAYYYYLNTILRRMNTGELPKTDYSKNIRLALQIYPLYLRAEGVSGKEKIWQLAALLKPDTLLK